ncbi:MAG: alpha/beta fold hydrolase [Planctomycetes bacterium]|nr:alpha/beta fold hydrolase [Planctomycetota bacterium]
MRTSRLIVTMLCPLLAVVPAQAGSGDAKGPSLAGAWLGTVQLSPTTSVRIAFDIQAKPDGSLSGTFLSLDQNGPPAALSRIGLVRGWVTMEVSSAGIRFEGMLNAEGSAITGHLTQKGVSLELVMKRVPALRPQEPARPYPYLEEEVAYQNTRDAVTLAGTLTLPPAGGPFPAVLLITGSGQEDRNETVYGHRPFLVLADYLTRRGLAVLRVDDRGVGGSTGDFSQASSEDFARDVLAGVGYLAGRKEIDPQRIGLIGHSEGGIIAPLAAVDANDVAFVVLMAGPGVPGDLIIEGQIAGLLKAQGASQAAIDATLGAQRRLVEVVKTETDPNMAREKLRNLGYTEAQIQTATSAWFRFFVTHDPQETLRQVKCPVLALNGTLDTQVSARVNLPAIEQGLREGGNTHFVVKELPGLNHLFQMAQTGNIDEYAQIEETIAPLALETIAQWIEAQTKQK